MSPPPRLAVRVSVADRHRRCYELCAKGVQRDPSWTLVHGTLLARRRGEPQHIAHAWLERDGQVYDAVHDRVYTLSAYPGVVEARYTSQETAALRAVTGNFGPWSTTERERAQLYSALLQ